LPGVNQLIAMKALATVIRKLFEFGYIILDFGPSSCNIPLQLMTLYSSACV